MGRCLFNRPESLRQAPPSLSGIPPRSVLDDAAKSGHKLVSYFVCVIFDVLCMFHGLLHDHTSFRATKVQPFKAWSRHVPRLNLFCNCFLPHCLKSLRSFPTPLPQWMNRSLKEMAQPFIFQEALISLQ